MYCTNCGNKMGAGDRFCANCGTARHGGGVENLVTRQIETCIVERDKTSTDAASKATFQATATGPKGTNIAAATPELEAKQVIDQQSYVIPDVIQILESVASLNPKRHIWMLGSGLVAIVTSFFLFGSIPTLGFLFLVTGIAAVAVTKFRIEWGELPSQKKAIAAPGVLLVISVLIVGYLLGLLI
ncbi:MAG: zinc-ribbon domain-containing protein [Actinomycetota bacterium]|nr:zinc-ribbon domain-containing protein [Actinomycetota bacterium]